MLNYMANGRYPDPDEEWSGSGPNVRHNWTGREILVANGLVPCPATDGDARLRQRRLEREAEWLEAVESIGWE